jgi:hypothetical protein
MTTRSALSAHIIYSTCAARMLVIECMHATNRPTGYLINWLLTNLFQCTWEKTAKWARTLGLLVEQTTVALTCVTVLVSCAATSPWSNGIGCYLPRVHTCYVTCAYLSREWRARVACTSTSHRPFSCNVGSFFLYGSRLLLSMSILAFTLIGFGLNMICLHIWIANATGSRLKIRKP